jgi:hypothetical protein
MRFIALLSLAGTLPAGSRLMVKGYLAITGDSLPLGYA